MKITAKTKISKIIKYDKNVIDVIASINKHFKKLKNPILCKMLASRVSVADAAKIGGVSTEAFLQTLESKGYEVEYPEKKEDKTQPEQKKPIMNRENVITLDVRPILESGVDPFDQIMKTLKDMPDDKTLLIINTFEPIPILNILKKRGYSYETERPEPGLVHCYLRKTGEDVTGTTIKASGSANDTFEEIENRFKGKMSEIDVRNLEMPMPMVTILEKLEKLPEGEALYVHHKRLPQYLLPELENRQYKLVKKEIDDDNLKLIIYK